MKCLNCGRESEHYLCNDCMTPEVLEKVYKQLTKFKAETCENPYLMEIAEGKEKEALRPVVLEILEDFEPEVNEFYYVRFSKEIREPEFENKALKFLESHDIKDAHSQWVLYDLLSTYLRNDFHSPIAWCERILNEDFQYGELYKIAGEFLGMIGEYEKALTAISKGKKLLETGENQGYFYASEEKFPGTLAKMEGTICTWRDKKAYWPSTEERRRVVAEFYDEKGISYPRIEKKPVKTPEDQFKSIEEHYDADFTNYCAFWCTPVFSVASSDICQIAAVKVVNGEITGTFCDIIKPWSAGNDAQKAAANAIGTTLAKLKNADDVDLIMKRFFAFVGDDILVSTDALGTQAQLISRAARYTGMVEIPNEFYDLLDMAAESSAEFESMINRECVVNHFGLSETADALQRANNNKRIFEMLKKY